MFGKSAGIVLELQRDCLNSNVPVSNILRKAKAIASKLDLADLVDWMDQELNGYAGSIFDLPPYRKGRGSPKFWNPYRGYCPIFVEDNDFGELVTTFCLSQSVAELEDLTSDGDSKGLIFKYPVVIERELQRGMGIDMECSLHFSKSQVKSTLDFVRNKLLDWTLELEKKGVIGSGFTFNDNEKREASAVTNHIYGSTIGVLGNVAGDAHNSKFFTSPDRVNFDALNDFMVQAEPAANGLPNGTREQAKQLLEKIREENSGEKRPNQMKGYLNALRKILEGAGGNLVAQAILSAMG